MGPDNTKNYVRINKTVLIAAVLVLAAGIFGWWLGHSDKSAPAVAPAANQQASQETGSSADSQQLVTYTIPDGWKQNTCAGNVAAFITPPGTTADCTANPVAPVKVSVDPSNSTDCNQLQNVSNVKKHTCISLYINGHKSLKSSTEYLASSSYKQSTTVNAYYIDTGKGVVKVEYTYTSDSQFQQGFDQLSNSVTVKN